MATGDILFLAHRIPFPPNRGDKIRAHHLLKKLATLGKVHVGCFAESEEDRAGIAKLAQIAASHAVPNRTKPLVLAGVEAVIQRKPVSLTAFHSHSLGQWVRDTIEAEQISTIVIFSGQMGQYIPENFAGRVIVDLCDVDSAKFEGYAEAGQRIWLTAREARLLLKEEERLARRADATILISQNEADLFTSRLQFPSMANVQVMGNGIDAGFFDPDCVAPDPAMRNKIGPHFVFTGQMDYPPNESAAAWVAREFLPKFRKIEPHAEFHIVGRNPSKAVLALSGELGVNVVGEVPDVRPYIAAADCVIAPLLIARGIQNKVLEAMAMQRPVLLTPQAATGIDAEDGLHWVKCEADPAEMVQRAESLLADPKLAVAMGKAARSFVLTNHDWDAMMAPLEGLLINHDEEARNAA